MTEISRTDTNHDDNIVFALTRYETDGYFSDRADSQDAWVFHGNRIQRLDGQLDFLIGAPGFDNRMAHELSKSGYKLYNPSKSVRVWHIHASEDRAYTTDNVIPPPYYAVKPVSLTDVIIVEHDDGLGTTITTDKEEESKLVFGGPFEYVWDAQGNFEMHYLVDAAAR